MYASTGTYGNQNSNPFISFIGKIGNRKKSDVKSDHLGNVMVVISDRKIGVDESPQDGVVDYYTADVLQATDYYPGGMLQPGRSFNSSSYRYGLMGYEKDDEIKGSGNSYDMGARLYDPRLVRVPTPDPLAHLYPGESPYSFAGNNPIYFIDEEGKTKTTYITTIENGEKTTVKYVNDDYVMEQTEWYLPDEGGHVFSIDWDYNVVQFITIDVDNNKVYDTGEKPLDKAWDDDIGWLDDAGATKQTGQAGGNSLVAPGLDLPGNASQYEPTAENPGRDIDISDLLGRRGGASLSGKIGQVVDVTKKGFVLGQKLGDIVDRASTKDRFCTTCNEVIDSETGKPVKDDGTTPKDSASYEEAPHN